jgi:hypothetical protein
VALFSFDIDRIDDGRAVDLTHPRPGKMNCRRQVGIACQRLRCATIATI